MEVFEGYSPWILVRVSLHASLCYSFYSNMINGSMLLSCLP